MTFAKASFQTQDFGHMVFPSEMFVDYIRVYQRSDVTNGVGCNPPSHPTTNYINRYTSSPSLLQTRTNILELVILMHTAMQT